MTRRKACTDGTFFPNISNLQLAQALDLDIDS
jgi:hypothetical protein